MSDTFSDADITATWNSFRSTYPSRPFCLLQPQHPNTNYNRLYQPPGFVAELGTKTTFAIVNRDDVSRYPASDWYTICNLAAIAGPFTSIKFVGVFIDDSGSMTTSTVAQSKYLFETRVAAAGLSIQTVVNIQEDWITPFLTTLT